MSIRIVLSLWQKKALVICLETNADYCTFISIFPPRVLRVVSFFVLQKRDFDNEFAPSFEVGSHFPYLKTISLAECHFFCLIMFLSGSVMFAK